MFKSHCWMDLMMGSKAAANYFYSFSKYFLFNPLVWYIKCPKRKKKKNQNANHSFLNHKLNCLFCLTNSPQTK